MLTMPIPTSYTVRVVPAELPTVSVFCGDWTFTVALDDAHCEVIAIDGDSEIIGGSVMEVVFGVLDEYDGGTSTPEVRYLRRNLFPLLEDIRTVLFTLADTVHTRTTKES